jgi:hypothetical protein
MSIAVYIRERPSQACSPARVFLKPYASASCSCRGVPHGFQIQTRAATAAIAKATEALRQAQDIRKGLPHAVAVLSMVGQNYRLTRDMKEAADALELPLASHPLTLRQIYADAPGQGAVVWKLGAKGRDAANEIDAVFREIVPEACGRKGKIVSMRSKARRRANG